MQERGPNLWLLFAPLKRTAIDYVAEKSCELGCSRIQPVLTARANVRTIRVERLRAHVVEAAEQCGRLSLPEVVAAAPLADVLARWPADRRLLFCDPRAAGAPIEDALAGFRRGRPWAVLIGPEGGFERREVERIAAHPAAVTVRLGPRVLRADTAAVAALSVLQAMVGDWGPEG